MYYNLVGALKRRLILELQDSFSRHPVYRKIVPNIQNKNAFTQQPQFGIIVKGSNASKVQLDPSNFVGILQSHVMLANVGVPVFPLEWVREDARCLAESPSLPTLPGVYYMEILSAPTAPGEDGYFIIDPLVTATNEPVLMFSTGFETEGQLQNEPLDATVRLYENRNFMLTREVDYNLGEKGAIEFLRPFTPESTVTADYRYPIASIGPVAFKWNTADTTTLPGVVLAFGKRAEVGQKVAVAIYSDRVETAEVYGGKHEVSLDLEVLARDTVQIEELADLTQMYLWGDKKAPLEFEGIEIMDVSQGGEAEEPIDETGENFQYSVSLTVQLRADWEIHIPMPMTISKILPEAQVAASDLFYQTQPVLVGRNSDFERIG